MKKEFYVVVDLEELTYQKKGNGTNLENADKFETLEQAKEELTNYDEDFKGAIYKVEQFIESKIKKVDLKTEVKENEK